MLAIRLIDSYVSL